MKKAVFILAMFLLANISFGQKVEKYIKVVTWPKSKKSDQIIVDFGADSTLFSFKDKTAKEKILQVQKYTNTMDALNYMGTLGWSLMISTESQLGGTTNASVFYFKKTFDHSELLFASNN